MRISFAFSSASCLMNMTICSICRCTCARMFCRVGLLLSGQGDRSPRAGAARRTSLSFMLTAASLKRQNRRASAAWRAYGCAGCMQMPIRRRSCGRVCREQHLSDGRTDAATRHTSHAAPVSTGARGSSAQPRPSRRRLTEDSTREVAARARVSGSQNPRRGPSQAAHNSGVHIAGETYVLH